jgi:hypothetical protein
MIRFASAIVIAAVLSGSGSLAASACGVRIDLAVIAQRIGDPNLESGLKEKAIALRTRAAAAIEAGHRDEGRRMYYQLMALLGVTASGRHRCN